MGCVIVDLDGTLVDEGKRFNNLDEFFEAIPYFRPNFPVLEILLNLKDTQIVFLTGRSEKVREQTEVWLRQHKVPYSDIYMRTSDQENLDAVTVKRSYLEPIARLHGPIRFALENDPRVIEEFCRLGIFTLGVFQP